MARQTLQDYGPMTPKPSVLREILLHMLCPRDILHGQISFTGSASAHG